MKSKYLSLILILLITITGCYSNSNNTLTKDIPNSTELTTIISTEDNSDLALAPTESSSEIVVEEETITADTEVTLIAETNYTVTAMDAIKYAKSSVNVRIGPSADYEKVGSLSTNQKVKVTGRASTGWYQIEFNGELAFVSDNYLVDEMVVVNTTPSTDASSSESNNNDYNAGDGNSTPSTPADGNNSTDNGDMSDWDDWEPDFEIGGSFDDCTDGYGPGVEIEISPAP